MALTTAEKAAVLAAITEVSSAVGAVPVNDDIDNDLATANAMVEVLMTRQAIVKAIAASTTHSDAEKLQLISDTLGDIQQ